MGGAAVAAMAALPPPERPRHHLIEALLRLDQMIKRIGLVDLSRPVMLLFVPYYYLRNCLRFVNPAEATWRLEARMVDNLGLETFGKSMFGGL